jgi:hypothetical protein
MAVSKSAVAIGLAAIFCVGWRFAHPAKHLLGLRSAGGNIVFVDAGDAPVAQPAAAAPAATPSPPVAPSPAATSSTVSPSPFDNAMPVVPPAADGAHGLDQRLVGAWNAAMPTQWGEWNLDFQLRPDGHYRTYNRGSLAPPDESGMFSAHDGLWSAANDDHSAISGQYEILGDGLVRFTYVTGGNVTYRRLSLSPNF